MKNITQSMRAIREAKGMSQAEVAEKLNLTQPTYARIEGGGSNLKLSTLYQFAEIMGVSILQLIMHPNNEYAIENDVIMKEVDLKFKEKVIELETRIEYLQQIVNDKEKQIEYLKTLIPKAKK